MFAGSDERESWKSSGTPNDNQHNVQIHETFVFIRPIGRHKNHLRVSVATNCKFSRKQLCLADTKRYIKSTGIRRFRIAEIPETVGYYMFS